MFLIGPHRTLEEMGQDLRPKTTAPSAYARHWGFVGICPACGA
jgi:hypothetical protein